MKNRKVIQLLHTFSAKELKSLEKFIASPFFNENESIQTLFAFLLQFAPTFESEQLTSEQAFAYIFPKQRFNDRSITKLLSKLYKLVEQFIIYTTGEANPVSTQIELLRFFNARQLPRFFESQLKELRRWQAKSPNQDERYYANRLLIEREQSAYEGNADDRTGDVNFQATNTALDVYYLINKLTLLCQMLNRQRSVNIDYDLALMDELLAFLDNSPYRDIPAIALWHNALLLLKHPKQVAHYQSLKKLLSEQATHFGKEEVRALYTMLENGSKQVMDNTSLYYQEVFDLYNIQLKNGILYQNGLLLPPIFKNMVTVALKLQKYDWAADFIHFHKDKIAPPYQEDAYGYNLANLHFHQKKYAQALGLLHQIEYKDAFTQLGVRRMQLMIYYDLDEMNLLDSAINAFRVFIHRHKKIAKAHKTAHKNFVNGIGKLMRLPPKDRSKVKKLGMELQAMTLLPEREWFEEKIREAM